MTTKQAERKVYDNATTAFKSAVKLYAKEFKCSESEAKESVSDIFVDVINENTNLHAVFV